MTTGTRPLDLFWKRTDLNGLPLNPDWIARSNGIVQPNSKHVSLHNACPACFTTMDDCDAISDIACWRNCTSYPSLSEDIANLCKVDPSCNHGGHLNWFPATYTGFVSFQSYAAEGFTGTFKDDDTSFTFRPDDNAGLAGRDDVIHSEMASSETIDRFQSGWWLAFHNAVHESKTAAKALVPGNRAIIIGLVGLDMQHKIHVELHPIYAMAIELESNPTKNRWAVFARNWGNEGWCARSDEHHLPSRAIVLSLPGPVGTTPSAVTETDHKFRGSGTVSEAFFTDRSAAIVFQIGDPDDETQINGEITLNWALPSGIAVAKPKRPQFPVLSAATAEEDELPGVELLTPTQRQQLNASLPPPPRDTSRDMLVPERVPFTMPAKLATAPFVGDVTTKPDPAKEKRDLQTVQTMCTMLQNTPKRPKLCSTIPPGPAW